MKTLAFLSEEFKWLKQIAVLRCNQLRIQPVPDLFGTGSGYSAMMTGAAFSKELEDIPLPPLTENPLHEYIREKELDVPGRILLALCMAPALAPDCLNWLLHQKDEHGNPLTALNGTTGRFFRGFVPTGHTWLYFAAGDDIEKRTKLLISIAAGHPLIAEKVVEFLPYDRHDPPISGPVVMSEKYLRYFLTGKMEFELQEHYKNSAS